MFRSTVTVTEPAPVDVIDPASFIPLSHLELDMPAPTSGWLIELDRRGIAVVSVDVGRLAVSRDDARQLLSEHRVQQEADEARRRAVREKQERKAVEADRAFRAALPKGLPWYEMPDGVSPAEAWRAAELAAQPKRTSVLEETLSNSGTMVYHPLPSTSGES